MVREEDFLPYTRRGLNIFVRSEARVKKLFKMIYVKGLLILILGMFLLLFQPLCKFWEKYFRLWAWKVFIT